MNNKFYCGIDVSKKKLDVVVLVDEKPKHKIFSNTNLGVKELEEWVISQFETNSLIHVCMEATNVYYELVADYLSEKEKFFVSVVNPRTTNYFVKMKENSKTDKTDAKLLAMYCKQENPKRYKPKSKEIKELKELTRLMDNLVEMLSVQKVRLQTFNTEVAARGVLSTIKSLEDSIAETKEKIQQCYENSEKLKQQYELLKTIPSFGDRVISVLLSELKDDDLGLYNPKKMTRYFGLEVKRTESGSSIDKKPRITKFGSARVRCMLYMAALVAISHNLFIAEFYNRLVSIGKPKKLALVAVMRKLLVIACAILNSGKPFDPNYVNPKFNQNKKDNVIYYNFGKAS